MSQSGTQTIAIVLQHELLPLLEILRENRTKATEQLLKRVAELLGYVTNHKFVKRHPDSNNAESKACTRCGRVPELHYYLPEKDIRK